MPLLGEVDFAANVLFFVVDEEDGTALAEEFDDTQPVAEVGVFAAVIDEEDIHRTFGEEKLVGGVVDFLSAKVPEVNAERFAVGLREFPVHHINAFGGGFSFFEFVVGVEEFVG